MLRHQLKMRVVEKIVHVFVGFDELINGASSSKEVCNWEILECEKDHFSNVGFCRVYSD